MSDILVVDDEKELLFLYEAGLEQSGHTVTGIRDADHALRIIQDTNYIPDVIILDINMVVGVSGFWLVERVREQPHLRRTQIVVITAEEEYRTYAEKQGIEHFVAKPFNIGDVVALIDRLVEARQT